jgi:hypothetical protein
MSDEHEPGRGLSRCAQEHHSARPDHLAGPHKPTHTPAGLEGRMPHLKAVIA